MPKRLDDLPDLALDLALSYLEWPYVMEVMIVNQRVRRALRGHVLFAPMFREQLEGIGLADPGLFQRTRAGLPTTAKSTIALAFSSDGKTLASTHGDHTVKLVDVVASVVSAVQPADGCVIAELHGHPRTPWTVKFHPTDPHLVASGCLGGHLRLWNANTQAAVRQATLPHPVISLSFHPDGKKLAAAAGTMLYIWDFENDLPPQVILQTKVSLRCVRFLDSHRLLVGVRSRSTHTGVTTYIRAARAQLLLYAYDDTKHVGISSSAIDAKGGRSSGSSSGGAGAGAGVNHRVGGNHNGDGRANGGTPDGSGGGGGGDGNEGPLLSHPVVVVRRALLYNDAGLDVTKDGATVLTCAEFWQLPQGGGTVGVGGYGGLGGYAPPVSPLAPHDFVGGGDADAGDAAADDEDAQFEREGAERVAHLIQVSLALPSSQSPSPTSSSSAASSADPSSSSSSLSTSRPSPADSMQMDNDDDLIVPPPPLKSESGAPTNPFAVPAPATAPGLAGGGGSGSSSLQGSKGPLPLPAVTPHAHKVPPPPPFPPRATDAAATTVARTRPGFSPFASTASLLPPAAGQLVRSASLEGLWAGAQAAASTAAQGGTFVTSVKLSPTGEYVLLGCSRGNTDANSDFYSRGDGSGEPWQHPVAAVWRLGDMRRMGTLTSRTNHLEEDDANVALFHPLPGAGVVYGTKQGQIACALSAVVLNQAGLLRRNSSSSSSSSSPASSRQSPLRGPSSPGA